MVVHSVLPGGLGRAVGEVLGRAGVAHIAHGYETPAWAAEVAARDPDAIALIGPYRSRDVAEAVEATAPAGLPVLAPIATWAGLTRDDEPGCDDHPARHRGTVLRLVARDTVVAARLAADLRAAGRTAYLIAGEHDYGLQLAGQLRLGGLQCADDPQQADVVVLAGLVGEPEIERAAALAPLPVIAFDGVQGADLGAGRDVRLALPFAPVEGVDPERQFDGTHSARCAAELVAAALAAGASHRSALLEALRERRGFDERGDPLDPPVWLWRAGSDWAAEPDRPLSGGA